MICTKSAAFQMFSSRDVARRPSWQKVNLWRVKEVAICMSAEVLIMHQHQLRFHLSIKYALIILLVKEGL